MGTGYTRNDASNNIADGNVINASDLDGEFDAVESAFGTSGHTHDGTAAEGGAITKVGPVQDIVVSATNVNPKTNNAIDLGTASLKYKDAHFQGSIDTDGVITAATFEPDGDTAAGDNAAIGYTAAEGLILTGQGSTNDVTIKNDADADVLEIPTGTTNVTVVGDITSGGTLNVTGDTAAGDAAAIGYTAAEGLILTGQGSTSDITLKNDADAVVFTVPTGTDDILFPDNAKAMFGAGSDLQIYHDGSHSYVTDQGTGRLYLQGTSNITFTNADGTAEYANFANGGAVSLRHNNGVKLATTSTGVDITGGFTATDGSTITVDDNSVALDLICTDTDASEGPLLRLSRDVAGAASDVIGAVQYNGYDADGNDAQYVELQARVEDATNGSEEGRLDILILRSGTARSIMNAMPAETVFNENSQDLDFRVESDNDVNAFFVQGSDGNCGIGTNSPATALSVVGTGTFTKTNNDANVILETSDTDANAGPLLDFYRNPNQAGADDDLIGRMEFNGLNDASEKTQFATIFSQIQDASDGTEDASLKIKTMLAGTSRDRISMNATETVINDGAQDLNFRVESDNDTAAFFVDGADGNVGMSSTNPASHLPTSTNTGKRSFVIHEAGGSQFVASRSDTTVTGGNYVGGYLFKTNDASGNKFGGMICTADDTTGNSNLEFYPISNAYENGSEGSMQLDDSGDIYLRGGGIKVGRSHGDVYTSSEENIIIHHVGSGSNDTSTQITSRDGTGGDAVFRHIRQGTVKSEIEENGDFLSATNSYGSTSDQRLKENIVAASSQWDDIKALQFKNYSMIEDELDAPNMLGVMAQDLQASGMNGLVKQTFQTDAEDNPVLDADGNQKEFLSVKYSVLYMKAIKALQEAMTKIETLETKVAALEAE